jgi:hypothetical protein
MRLGRGPREVYRVYEEEEFLASTDHADLSIRSAPGSHERRLGRLAGATILAATLAGLTVLSTLTLNRGPLRLGGRARSSSGPRARAGIASAGIWVGSLAARPRPTEARPRRRNLLAVQRAPRSRPPVQGGTRSRLVVQGAQRSRRAMKPGAPMQVRSVLPLTANVSGDSRPPAHPEFGFER